MTDTRGAVGSYDDLPESEVATVLEVPLLWPAAEDARLGTAPPPPTPAPTVLPASTRARHRSGGGGEPGTSGRHRAATAQASSEPGPLVHTARIGLISAAVVLSGTAVVLLVVARILP